MIESARTLPLRVALADGEAFDSWLRRLAHRNGIPVLRLATALGFTDRLHVWRNYALSWRLPTQLLRRVETQTGLAPGALDAAVLDQFDPLGWKPIPGSRYCPTCLSSTGGRWPIRWQLPYTFACTTHRCLLAVLCPACSRIPHHRISKRSGQAPPTVCTLGTSRRGSPCGGDLLTHRPRRLRAGDARLAAQQWVNERLDRLDADAVTALRDLDALAIWFRQRIHPTELAHLGRATVDAMRDFRDHRQDLKRHQPTAALVAAALTSQAITVITADDHGISGSLTPLLRDVYTKYRTGQTPSARGPMILSHKRLTSLSLPLQQKVLRGIDGQTPVTERLRYRTRTPTPRAPRPGCTAAADRARYIPQQLWADWIIRLRPPRGWHPAEAAATLPNALLIPGNPVRNLHATTELSPWRAHSSIVLARIAAQYPDVLTAICNIADYLDTHGAPIDYRRRRATFTDLELSTIDWEALCARAGVEPGRGALLRNARRHLTTLLTGGTLAGRRHPHGSPRIEHGNHLQFQHRMASTLREELRRYAEHLLASAHIDEPLTWSPPATCVTGLALPGREPDDIDMDVLARLILVDNLPAQQAARNLDVCIEHVRYATQHLHRPARAYPKNTQSGARILHGRAAELLTAEFFHREHVQGGKDFATLAAETGYSIYMQQLYARRAGVAAMIREAKSHTRKINVAAKTERAPRGSVIDPDWLRKQATTLLRTNTDIATELGLSHETVRRHSQALGITARRTGTYSDRRYPDLPNDIRRAVEGKRHGWQRLRRFEQVTAFHSINTAAAALGHHTQNLNLQIQRLETDLGTQLLTRGHRYQPITPTKRGHQLLRQLHRPDVQPLLDQHAPPDAHQTRRCYRRAEP